MDCRPRAFNPPDCRGGRSPAIPGLLVVKLGGYKSQVLAVDPSKRSEPLKSEKLELCMVENTLNLLVTLASGGFKTIAIQNGDISATVLNQPALL